MIEITKATKADIQELTGVFAEAFNKGEWKQNWSQENAKLFLSNIFQFPDFYGLVAKKEGLSIGALLGHIQIFDQSQTFYLDELFVLPEFQKMGIAKKIYGQAIDELKERGVGGSFFTTLRNSSAYNFYISQGAIDVKDSAVFYHPF